MRKIISGFILTALVTALFGVQSTALAAGERTGTRFSILVGTPTEFTANAPFFFDHGWVFPVGTNRSGLGAYGFSLEVDGSVVVEDFVDRSGAGGSLRLEWVINFPDGLPAGTHTFTGHWIAPCQPSVDEGLYPGPCASRNEPVEISASSLVVEFIP